MRYQGLKVTLRKLPCPSVDLRLRCTLGFKSKAVPRGLCCLPHTREVMRWVHPVPPQMQWGRGGFAISWAIGRVNDGAETQSLRGSRGTVRNGSCHSTPGDHPKQSRETTLVWWSSTRVEELESSVGLTWRLCWRWGSLWYRDPPAGLLSGPVRNGVSGWGYDGGGSGPRDGKADAKG